MSNPTPVTHETPTPDNLNNLFDELQKTTWAVGDCLGAIDAIQKGEFPQAYFSELFALGVMELAKQKIERNSELLGTIIEKPGIDTRRKEGARSA